MSPARLFQKGKPNVNSGEKRAVRSRFAYGCGPGLARMNAETKGMAYSLLGDHCAFEGRGWVDSDLRVDLPAEPP